ncbi:MAG: replication-relaxation family protein [Actinobacteria bacterium]|nr:replication-relaxation family protein [Actinomycetota bacterium]
MTKSEKTRLPRYKKAKSAPPMILTERDKRIVSWVYPLRFLTSEQIKLLEFEEGSMTACRRRLALLYHNGYLTNTQKPVPTGYGSAKRVYCLSRKGKDLITHTHDGTDLKDIKWTEKNNKVADFFIEHILAINDVRIVFISNIRKAKSYSLDWTPEWEIKAWKEKVEDPENSGKSLPITPDAFFEIRNRKNKAYYFLEVDRATESNKRWKDKVRGYVAYVRTNKYYERFKAQSLRILAVTTSQERLDNLFKTTKGVEHSDFFLFTTFKQIKENNVLFDKIWKSTETNELRELIKF